MEKFGKKYGIEQSNSTHQDYKKLLKEKVKTDPSYKKFRRLFYEK